jgi:membrane-associated phospholipid phosphatase
VAGSFALTALWRRDAEIMWALMGAVVNKLLSSILKMMFNHERPAPALRSDPGMPSSHAQSIFYAAVFLVLSGKHFKISLHSITVLLLFSVYSPGNIKSIYALLELS